MKKIYIHIGTHKTGTTAIQNFSGQHAKKLEALDVFYPVVSRAIINDVPSLGHHLLPWYLLNHPVPDKFFGQFEDKKQSLFPSLIAAIKSSNCDNVVLSSEAFDRLDQEQILKLHGFFQQYDIKIIVYLRRKDAYLESRYQTKVIHYYESKELSEIMTKLGPLNYFDFIRSWQDVFGVDNVLVRFYCKKSMIANNIVVDFYDQLGIDVKDMTNTGAAMGVNKSVPFHYVSMIATMRRDGVPDHIINTIKRIASKIGSIQLHNFHFLSLEERIKLAKSGLEEVEKLNIPLPDRECFLLPEAEVNEKENAEKHLALKKVFDDFENILK